MKLDEMETAVKKLVQGKTIASVEIKTNRCKLIFEDLTFAEFYADVPTVWPSDKPDYPPFGPRLGVRWGKEKKSEDSSDH